MTIGSWRWAAGMIERVPLKTPWPSARRIGVMQGRLSPPLKGRIQAFPSQEWRDEFTRARAIGLSSIEWIFEAPIEENPFWTDAGLEEIRCWMESTGVAVEFICADIFMELPWVRMSGDTRDRNRVMLNRLIDQACRLGLRGIEIPCVDASEIRIRAEEDELLAGIEPCLDHAMKLGIEIGLETSLSPDRFRRLFERCEHPAMRANYDTGNGASLGYDGRTEIAAYGRWINNVHIKDRRFHGSTVPLGTGDADIPEVLGALREAGYGGGFILQAARGAEEVNTVRGYRDQLALWLRESSAGVCGP
ncbi:MAG: sugar phosphate isomerase/epimerase [Verrucomicrobiales bacterium]|nr:sugar phosphate isomerase/epimerase [Verrucomicrobiales bacterium]